MKTNIIEHKMVFNCNAETLYWILMNENLHSEVMGAEAKIENFVGGKFSVFDGYAHGETIGLIKYKIIIQNWQFDEDGWPEAHFSVCCFELVEINDQTTLHFIHKGVPMHLIDSLTKGWENYYWSPINNYLKEREKN